MKILGIESSCDETAAAILDGKIILSDLIATQHDVHERFGGVVPELASRRHIENIAPLIKGALSESNLSLSDLDGIAVTYAPGLVGSLLVGLATAKGLAFASNLPIIGVNHLEGHLNACALEFGEIPTPYIGLVVSGGHTSLYHVKGFGDYELMGATRDDAAGEAFDKVAKLLKLGYPGGPAIDKAAEKGDPKAYRFTKPKFDKGNPADFSFSGIKTAVMLLHRKESDGGAVSEKFVRDVAASFQESVVKVLIDGLLGAAEQRGAKSVVLAGGVAANRRLRASLKERSEHAGIKCYIPKMSLCTDNAAMIAYVGGRRLAMGEKSDLKLNAVANMEIGV